MTDRFMSFDASFIFPLVCFIGSPFHTHVVLYVVSLPIWLHRISIVVLHGDSLDISVVYIHVYPPMCPYQVNRLRDICNSLSHYPSDVFVPDLFVAFHSKHPPPCSIYIS